MLDVSFGSSVGKKFNADGTFRRFPGNTIVCLLDHASEIFDRSRSIREELTTSVIASCLAPLPDESLHMTAIEGVCDHVRKPRFWTQKLPIDSDITQVDAFFLETWDTLPLLGEVRMTVDHLRVDNGICIGLVPSTEQDEKLIRDWRDLVGEALGLRFPGHDSYAFHISLAYGIKMPNTPQMEFLEQYKTSFDQMSKVVPFSFVVPEPSLTFFDDMSYFSSHPISRSL